MDRGGDNSQQPNGVQEESKFGYGRLENIDKIETLGEGAYGIVYKGKNKKTG